MGFEAATCPSCNKQVQIPDDVDSSICMYCGSRIEYGFGASPASGTTLVNLLGLARTATIGGNVVEAIAYFNRVLEIDPKVVEAWIGKGKAAGWQSSITNMRLAEMEVAFTNAIGASLKGERESIKAECQVEVNKLVAALFGMARKHMIEYVALANTWVEYLDQVGQLLNALETAYSWNTSDKQTLENIIFLCKDNIEGVTFRDPYNNNFSKALILNAEYEASMRARLNRAGEKLKTLNPSYVAPNPEPAKLPACFVVTATMGGEMHPTVVMMREFRDSWIRKQGWGDMACDVYYSYGPGLAQYISKSNFRRRVSYFLLIGPSVFFVKSLRKFGYWRT